MEIAYLSPVGGEETVIYKLTISVKRRKDGKYTADAEGMSSRVCRSRLKAIAEVLELLATDLEWEAR